MGNRKAIAAGAMGVLILLIIAGGIWLVISMATPVDSLDAVEKKLDISIRDKVSVVEERRIVEYGEELVNLKLLINDGETSNIEKTLEEFFPREDEEEYLIPNFQNTCPWWDMNKDHIKKRYSKMISGDSAMTLEIWAFIVEEPEADYLYIAY